jgi:3-methylcrotonyl-CoA carboxylase alpha subunit
MFRKILIANRGEIACRIIRTARRMGIATVAVYSDADAQAMHVAMADAAIRIGTAAPRDSYLRIDAILAAARQTGAQAIHPGYGFLAENAGFADACAEAGVVFIGPPASAIRAMGGKSEAKALMAQAGVPLVPGYHDAAQDLLTLHAAADKIGYPVLIKASAGGGGKGMRVVAHAAEFAQALAGAQREAASSFGDDRVLIEKYLTRPRHIEIQVFADSFGNCVHLFERDCSIQRRHQKIIEEAPAPGMTDGLRADMGRAAVAAAQAVGYVGAGTVEFIVEDGQFHFMEMNTRLQVEHPVTEMITGLDLVEWQLRVAAGEKLPLGQADLAINGHAIEIRLCAEDPGRDFLPSVGVLQHLTLPDDIRVDAGVRAGDRISPDYDPMIAKLIVHGADRAGALGKMAAALRRAEVVGVATNLGLLRAILAHDDFAAGDFDTGFIGRHPEVLAVPAEVAPAAIAAAVLTVVAARAAANVVAGDAASPWGGNAAWRMNLPGAHSVLLRQGEHEIAVTARAQADGGWALAWDGQTHMAALRGGRLRLGDAACAVTMVGLTVLLDGVATGFVEVDPLVPPQASAAGGGKVMAPIPGRVASVLVAVGDAVVAGQVLVVMEAMKMEISLAASSGGVVVSVNAVVGEMIGEGTEVVVIGDGGVGGELRMRK